MLGNDRTHTHAHGQTHTEMNVYAGHREHTHAQICVAPALYKQLECFTGNTIKEIRAKTNPWGE